MPEEIWIEAAFFVHLMHQLMVCLRRIDEMDEVWIRSCYLCATGTSKRRIASSMRFQPASLPSVQLMPQLGVALLRNHEMSFFERFFLLCNRTHSFVKQPVLRNYEVFLVEVWTHVRFLGVTWSVFVSNGEISSLEETCFDVHQGSNRLN